MMLVILDSVIFVTYLSFPNFKKQKGKGDGHYSTDLKGYYSRSRTSISPPSSAQIGHL